MKRVESDTCKFQCVVLHIHTINLNHEIDRWHDQHAINSRLCSDKINTANVEEICGPLEFHRGGCPGVHLCRSVTVTWVIFSVPEEMLSVPRYQASCVVFLLKSIFVRENDMINFRLSNAVFLSLSCTSWQFLEIF